ncbi:MAG: ATP-binding protein, partial [Bacteroidota bacterium]
MILSNDYRIIYLINEPSIKRCIFVKIKAERIFEPAVKTAQPKKIAIKIFDNPSGYIVIRVIDNWKGIAPEDLEKIFIPFYTTKEGGSGIGLSLSRQIMRMHKGSM